MTDAPFILAGWLGTAGVIAAYGIRVRVRTARAMAARTARETRS